MADKSSGNGIATKAQDYVDKGISYLQRQTFGTAENETTGETTGKSKEKSIDTAQDPKIDEAPSGKIEEFIRDSNKSEPVGDILKDKHMDS